VVILLGIMFLKRFIEKCVYLVYIYIYMWSTPTSNRVHIRVRFSFFGRNTIYLTGKLVDKRMRQNIGWSDSCESSTAFGRDRKRIEKTTRRQWRLYPRETRKIRRRRRLHSGGDGGSSKTVVVLNTILYIYNIYTYTII
jgi:hypothetical protein